MPKKKKRPPTKPDTLPTVDGERVAVGPALKEPGKLAFHLRFDKEEK
jgi:hypothetical protein